MTCSRRGKIKEFIPTEEAIELANGLKRYMSAHGMQPEESELVLAEALVRAFWSIPEWTVYLLEPAAMMEQDILGDKMYFKREVKRG